MLSQEEQPNALESDLITKPDTYELGQITSETETQVDTIPTQKTLSPERLRRL